LELSGKSRFTCPPFQEVKLTAQAPHSSFRSLALPVQSWLLL
jgi:hypothetical protein